MPLFIFEDIVGVDNIIKFFEELETVGGFTFTD